MFWAGSFAAYTYLVPLLHESAGLGYGTVAWVLLLAGVMAAAGNLLGGPAADRSLAAALLVTAAATLAALAALWAFRSATAAAVVLVAGWQLAAWSFVPAIQALLFELGGDAGMSFSVSAFNLGIIVGAGAGGLALDAGGLGAVLALATGLTAVAIGLVGAVTAGLTAGRGRA